MADEFNNRDTPEERAKTRPPRRKEQARFVVHTKFLIDTLQRVAHSEIYGTLPDVKFSAVTEVFLIGIEETKSYSLMMSLLIPLLYIGASALYVIKGIHIHPLVIDAINIITGIVFAVFAYMRIAFNHKFAKQYIRGEHSKRIWEIYLKGNLYGFAGLYGAVGIVIAFGYWGIMKAFRQHPEQLHTIITHLYNSLHTQEQRIRLYQIGIDVLKQVVNPVPEFIHLVVLYVITAGIIAYFTYYLPKSQVKIIKDKDMDSVKEISDIIPEEIKKPE